LWQDSAERGSAVFGRLLVGAAGGSETMGLEHYQAAFAPMLLGIVAAATLTCLLKETGPAGPRGKPDALTIEA
jgi:hypothetical protein